MSSHSGLPQSCGRPWRLLLFHVKRSLNLGFIVVAVGLLVSLGLRRSASKLADCMFPAWRTTWGCRRGGTDRPCVCDAGGLFPRGSPGLYVIVELIESCSSSERAGRAVLLAPLCGIVRRGGDGGGRRCSSTGDAVREQEFGSCGN